MARKPAETLLAARRGSKLITMSDFSEAEIKVIAGPEKKSRVVSEHERKLTAYHEAGHAVQYAVGYVPIRIRSAVIPISQFGSSLSMPVLLVGLLFNYGFLVQLGIVLFSTVALFQLVTLPVEFNASARALRTLESSYILESDEVKMAGKVLRAAALTYVAALLSSLAQLLRLILLFGRRDRD